MKWISETLNSFQGKRLALAVILGAGTLHSLGELNLAGAIIAASGGALYGVAVVLTDILKA